MCVCVLMNTCVHAFVRVCVYVGNLNTTTFTLNKLSDGWKYEIETSENIFHFFFNMTISFCDNKINIEYFYRHYCIWF